MLLHSNLQNKQVIGKAGAKGKASTLVKVIKLQHGWQKKMFRCAGNRKFPGTLPQMVSAMAPCTQPGNMGPGPVPKCRGPAIPGPGLGTRSPPGALGPCAAFGRP